VRDAFFEALRPASLDLLEQLLSERTATESAIEAQWQRRLEHARYEARLAERRYRAVDAENRLVATSLERDWNAALAELEGVEAAYGEYQRQRDREHGEPWTPELRTQLRHLGATLPEFWPELTNGQRTRLIRALVSQVVVQRTRPQEIRLRILWQSGHYTERTLVPGVLRFRDLDGYDEICDRIRRWVNEDQLMDAEIATRLQSEGVRAPRVRVFSSFRVAYLRRQLGLPAASTRSWGKERLDGSLDGARTGRATRHRAAPALPAAAQRKDPGEAPLDLAKLPDRRRS
jgi:hypothetical protein